MKILRISKPPDSIPCWYCGQPCPRWHSDQRLYPGLDYSTADRWKYHCNGHQGLDIEVTCVRNRKEDDDAWFFNRIAVIHKSLRLHWNFYAGNVFLMEYKQPILGKSGGEWKFVHIQKWPPIWKVYPPEFLNQTPEQLLSFFRLYRVFS